MISSRIKNKHDRNSKLKIKLEPQVFLASATKELMAALLDIMQLNEQGIRQDWDSEFLHEYRIALRKARSLFREFGFAAFGTTNSEPSIQTQNLSQLNEELKWIGQQTNELRDIDVYLSQEKTLLSHLPKKQAQNMTIFFDHLRNRRESARIKVIKMLDSPKYALFFQTMRQFTLAKFTEEKCSGLAVAITTQKIHKIYQKICKFELAKSKDFHDQAKRLHRLRIQCKRLRYLIEMFGSLFEKKTIQSVAIRLKALQDLLGHFNDFSVQQLTLMRFHDQCLRYEGIPQPIWSPVFAPPFFDSIQAFRATGRIQKPNWPRNILISQRFSLLLSSSTFVPNNILETTQANNQPGAVAELGLTGISPKTNIYQKSKIMESMTSLYTNKRNDFIDTSLSLGMLIGIIQEKQKNLLAKFDKQYNSFCAKRVRRSIDSLIKIGNC